MTFQPLIDDSGGGAKLAEYVMAVKGDYLASQYNQSVTLIILVPLALLLVSIFLYLIALCLCGFKSPHKDLHKTAQASAQSSQTYQDSTEQDQLLNTNKSNSTCCTGFIIFVIILTSTLTGLAIFFTVTGHERAVQFNDKSSEIMRTFHSYKYEIDDMRRSIETSLNLFSNILKNEKSNTGIYSWLETAKGNIEKDLLGPIRDSIPSPSKIFLENTSTFLEGKFQTEWLRTIFLCCFGVIQFTAGILGLVGLIRKSNALILTFICMSLISLVVISLLNVFHLNVMVRTGDFCNLRGEGMYDMMMYRMKLGATRLDENGTSFEVENVKLTQRFAEYYYNCPNSTKPSTVFDFTSFLKTFEKTDYPNRLLKIQHFVNADETRSIIDQINVKLSAAYSAGEKAEQLSQCSKVMEYLNDTIRDLCNEEMYNWALLLTTITVLFFCNLIALCAGPKIHNKFRSDVAVRRLKEHQNSTRYNSRNTSAYMSGRQQRQGSQKTGDLQFAPSNGAVPMQPSHIVEQPGESAETPPYYRGLTSVTGGAHLRLQHHSQSDSQPASQQFKNPNYDEHSLAKHVNNRIIPYGEDDQLIPPQYDIQPDHMVANPNYQHFQPSGLQ